MVNTAYDCGGVIDTDLVPVGSSLTGDYYANLRRQKFRPKIPSEPTAVVGSWCVGIP